MLPSFLAQPLDVHLGHHQGRLISLLIGDSLAWVSPLLESSGTPLNQLVAFIEAMAGIVGYPHQAHSGTGPSDTEIGLLFCV